MRVSSALMAAAAPLALWGVALGASWTMSGGRAGHGYVLRFALPPAQAVLGLPPVLGPADPTRPLVLIDAGHGGHDPGAGEGAIKEKTVTLALAMALRDRLLAMGGVRVALTRSDDRYLLLEERSGLARRMGASLFLSIHADSSEKPEASGATVYTLSTRGSTQEAGRLAASENSADMVNGVPLAPQGEAVGAILVDLAQRRSASGAEDFARLVLREGAGRLAFREHPVQSAAFVVLKSPDVPSVLFEAGYISNPADYARLTSPEGRAAFADVTAGAIRLWLARQMTLGPAEGAPLAVASSGAVL